MGYVQAVAGRLGEREPSQRFTVADPDASAMLVLASDAADNTPGINLAVDGVWTAQLPSSAGRRVFCQ